MASSDAAVAGGSTSPATGTDTRGEGSYAPPITAVKLRHPIRSVVAVILIIILLMVIEDAATREAFHWPRVGQYLFDSRIFQAVGITLALTVLSMIFAVVLGLLLAVMRLSDNPVLRSLAWAYLWVFRGTPVYVQLVFWGLMSTIYASITVGIPFTGIDFFTISPFKATDLFWIAVLGLGCNEAAYMAEIVRSGILSVDRGQEEAAKALGMSWWRTMVRIIIPQSMRVIIPPTGNELISMLKTTSLVTALGYTMELYARSRSISAALYDPVPLLIVASIWYLAVTSILMVGQHYLEAYYARGFDVKTKRGGHVHEDPAPATAAISLPRDGETASALLSDKGHPHE